MSKRSINRLTLGVLIVTSLFALSACWGANTTPADPGYVLRHDFSLSPGLWPGALTDCFYVSSSVPNRNALCRLVEGEERVGQPGNWDVKFDGGDTPLQENCLNLFTDLGCFIVAPDGTTYEGCYPYNQDGTHVDWCDYKTSHWFAITLNNNPWAHVLHTWWDWGPGILTSEIQCSWGLINMWNGQGAIDNDWLVSCFDGP